jgi:hypothetical protein
VLIALRKPVRGTQTYGTCHQRNSLCIVCVIGAGERVGGGGSLAPSVHVVCGGDGSAVSAEAEVAAAVCV